MEDVRNIRINSSHSFIQMLISEVEQWDISCLVSSQLKLDKEIVFPLRKKCQFCQTNGCHSNIKPSLNCHGLHMTGWFEFVSKTEFYVLKLIVLNAK